MATYNARGSRLTFSGGTEGFAQGIQRVVGLKDGGFAVTWVGADNDRTPFDGDLFGLVFGADLAPTTADPIRMIDNTGPTTSYPINQAVSNLAGGGFAVLTTDNAAYAQANAASQRDAVLRIYDASGNAVGSPVNLGASSIVGVTLTTLEDGRLVAGWTDPAGGVRAAYLSPTGTPQGSSFVVAAPAGDIAARPSFTALTDGGWVATYVSQNKAEGRAVFYDAAGRASIDQLIATGLTSISGLQVDELADGRALFVWTRVNAAQMVETRAQLYNQDGTKFGSELLVSNIASSVVSVTSLEDGGFAIALEPRQSGPVEVKVYNSIGQQNGATITIANAFSPSIASLADGGFVLTWQDSTTQDFQAQAYQAVAAGNLTVNGTAAGDFLAGQEGNDTINGLAGNDQLFGSLGNDTIFGGIGDDRLEGGLGDDLLNGGAGNDLGFGGAGFDTAAFAGLRSAYTVGFTSDGRIRVQGADGLDFLDGIERLSFADGQADVPADLLQDPFLALNSFGAADAAGGWSSNNLYPRTAADLNGDGRADLIGFGSAGVYTALANNSGGFGAVTLAFRGFGASDAAGGWSSDDRFPRMLGDVNGDGRADLVGFGANGVFAALGDGQGGFGATYLAKNSFGYAPAGGGWSSDDLYPRTLGDVNGDGRDDIVGFGSAGVYVSLATGGGQFGDVYLATALFGGSDAAGGWSTNTRFPRMLADVNADGLDDLVGFGANGVFTALATGNGQFGAVSQISGTFGSSDASGGWSSNLLFPRMMADMNGDDAADIVGFGGNGVFVSLNDGSGQFGPVELELNSFGFSESGGGWRDDNTYPRIIADMNGDGLGDVVGFGSAGVYLAYAESFTVG
jgi:Ca2+-binding RTX toxin-like protein